jgi:hypothetical protein
MNNEVLNHTDIPVGESFILANDNIKGTVVENGKVSVGCSLQISALPAKLFLMKKICSKKAAYTMRKKRSY